MEEEGEDMGGDAEEMREGEEEVGLEAEGDSEGNKIKEENIFRSVEESTEELEESGVHR